MQLSGETFIQKFETYCPQSLAESGDPVGLHLGTLKKPVQRILVTLDVRPEVVAEAVAKNVDLIIAKHPPIFRSIHRLTTDDPQTAMYAELLKHDISVYAAHTNLDIIPNGLNDWLAEELGLEVTDYVAKTHTIPYKKLAVFVPKTDAAAMRAALGAAGAGQQGNYEKTSYSLTGVGRFTPVAGANPTLGQLNQEEAVAEEKIEVIFPETQQNQVVAAMLAAHPYEEPAYDLYTIENLTADYGIGRIGQLAQPMTLTEFVAHVKASFGLDGLRVITPSMDKKVQTIALCGGSGEKFFRQAQAKGADVYVTGDVYFHTGHDMLTADFPVIDPGHYIESLCKSRLVALFNDWKQTHHWDVTFLESEVNTNPFRFY